MDNQAPQRKRVKHFHLPGHFHELTFSTYRRRPLLTNDAWRTILARSIDNACRAESCQLIAMVFMPEHVHLLVLPVIAEASISRLLQKVKQPTSRQIKTMLVDARSRLLDELTIQERPGKRCFRFWQEGSGYDRNLFQPAVIEAAIDYIHENPVRRGLCQRAIDWKWSSARFYLDGIVDPRLPRLSFPPTELFDNSGVQLPHTG